MRAVVEDFRTFSPGRCSMGMDRSSVAGPVSAPGAQRPAETPGPEYACWFPVGTPEGRKALADNVAAGVPAAVVATSGDASVLDQVGA